MALIFIQLPLTTFADQMSPELIEGSETKQDMITDCKNEFQEVEDDESQAHDEESSDSSGGSEMTSEMTSEMLEESEMAVEVTNGDTTMKYSTWEEAIEAVEENGIITLLEDIKASSMPNVACIVDGGSSGSNYKFEIDTSLSTDITFKDITISVIDGGELECQNNNITILGTVSANGIINCKMLTVDGTLTLDNKCEIATKLSGTGNIVFTSEKGELYSPSEYFIDENASITLKAGSYTPVQGQTIIYSGIANHTIFNIDKLVLEDGFSTFMLQEELDNNGYYYYMLADSDSNLDRLALSSGMLRDSLSSSKSALLLAAAVSNIEIVEASNSVTYGMDVTVTATLKDSSGNALDCDGTMELYLDGTSASFYSQNSSSTSSFTATLTKPVVGDHTITAKYNGVDSNGFKQTATNTDSFTVVKADGLLATTSDEPILVPSPSDNNSSYLINLADHVSFNKTDTGKISYFEVSHSGGCQVFKYNSFNESMLCLGLVSDCNGKTDTFKLRIETDNYNPAYVTLAIQGDNTIGIYDAVQFGGFSYGGNLTYGDPLSKLSIYVYYIYNQKNISGRALWEEPNQILPAGNNSALWAFYPDDLAYKPRSNTIFDINVAKRPITLTLKQPSYSRKYGDDDSTLDYTITSGTLVAGEKLDMPLIADGTSVGTHSIIVNYAKNSNYQITLSNGTNALTIHKRPVTLDTVTVADKVYDGTNVAGKAAVTFKNAVVGDNITYNAVSSQYSSADAGTYNTTVTTTLSSEFIPHYELSGDNQKTVLGRIVKATTTAVAPTSVKVPEKFSKTYSLDLDSIVLNDVEAHKAMPPQVPSTGSS